LFIVSSIINPHCNAVHASSETLPGLIQKHNTVLNLVVLFTHATLQITHFVTFLELTLINPHRYNWKSSDKLASICLYFLQIHATNPINHTPPGLEGKNTGTDITLLHSEVTLIHI
jgi:hypothetical protein